MDLPGVILLDPLADGFHLLLNREIAGVPLFHRLALTLNRAGPRRIVVISRHLPPADRVRQEQGLKADPRFRGELAWFDAEEFLQEGGTQALRSTLGGDSGFLMLSGNIVTTPRLIRTFLRDARAAGSLEQRGILSLQPEYEGRGGIHLVAGRRGDLLERYARGQPVEMPVQTLAPSGVFRFWMGVGGAHSARRAGELLIAEYQHHYTQWMDIHFNSRFSLKISALLVKTPVTPNQLKLSGLLIGLTAGLLFACGDYPGGLLGGLVAAFTAIWDCCEGDVARLKFMEPDCGETLDRVCGNLIHVLVFTGIATGVARTSGLEQALIPFGMLVTGGLVILILIYFPRGKGGLLKGAPMYDTVRILTSRNFIYLILIFAIAGKMGWFLWIAGTGSLVLALTLFIRKSPQSQAPRRPATRRER